MERPDLSGLADEIVAYIEALEYELMGLKSSSSSQSRQSEAPLEPDEPESSLNLITMTAAGVAKRSLRYLYGRQRRSGMGIFDLETGEENPPTLLTIADTEDTLILFTNHGRAFRVPVNQLPAAEVRARGHDITAKLNMRPDETIIGLLPAQGLEYAVLASERGWVRRVRRQYLGEKMLAGNTFHNVKEGGYLAAVCWSDGEDDILLASRQGQGIRFAERQIPNRGCLGMRLNPDDQIIAVTSTSETGGVFLLGPDGKGTIRLMSGFRQNKAPGAGGKLLLKSDYLVAATAVTDADDIFIISKQSKIIRFAAAEIPAKTGVVQGVNCMSLRADETSTAVMAPPLPVTNEDV